MRGDGVPVAPGMLDGEAVAAGIMKAEGAILGLFQETGLQYPQGVVHSENQWRHHGYHAFPGPDAQAASAAAVRGGLLIALRADVFAAEEVRDVMDIVPGKAMALDVVTAGGTLTVINVHGPGSGGDSWASKASFWADVAMYAATKSAGGTRAVLPEGTSTYWWSLRGTPPRGGSKPCGNNVGSTGRAYSHAQGLHAIRPDSPGVREAALVVPQKACEDRTLEAWLSSDQDTPTMGTSEVQAVFDLLYAFRDDVSRVTGVRMPSGMDLQYPYRRKRRRLRPTSSRNQKALAWRAHELWQRDAATAGLHSQEAAALLRHLRRVDPDLSPATVDDLRATLDQQLHQPETRLEERGAAGCTHEQQTQDHQGLLAGQGAGPAAPTDSDTGGHHRGELCPVRPVVRTRPGIGEGALGGLGRHWRGPEVLGGAVRQAATEPAGLRAAGPGPHSQRGAGGMEDGAGLHLQDLKDAVK